MERINRAARHRLYKSGHLLLAGACASWRRGVAAPRDAPAGSWPRQRASRALGRRGEVAVRLDRQLDRFGFLGPAAGAAAACWGKQPCVRSRSTLLRSHGVMGGMA